MKNLISLLQWITVAWIGGAGLAPAVAAPVIQAGEYQTAGGWGTLTITKHEDGALMFLIESVGANGHQCDLEGEIRDNKAMLDVGEGERLCTVQFKPLLSGIDVSVNEEDFDLCRYFCGARASYYGTYLHPAAGCTHAEREAARDKFKDLYGQKKYAKARATLEPLLKTCARTLDRYEEAGMRNDLAVTQYHLRDYDGCLATLNPLNEIAGLSYDQLKDRFPPADADTYDVIAQAARTNLHLCKAKRNR